VSQLNFKCVLVTAILGSAFSASAAAEAVSAECRGVAAGVVASMRAAGELASEESVAIAVQAARRGCAGAYDGFGAAAIVEPGAKATESGVESKPAVVAEQEAAKEPTVWELLTRDKELKEGNKRLRRLKTQ